VLSAFGNSIAALRHASTFATTLTGVTLFALSRRAIGPGIAHWLGACIFTLLAASPSMEGLTANAEVFAVLPLTAAAYFT
jgi:hypothetical protein